MPSPIVMTAGEPAGIGPDIALALWARREELSVPPFVMVGDADHLRDRADRLGIVLKLGEGGRQVSRRPPGKTA